MPAATGAPGTFMPAEWEPHTRTWMAFPTANATFGPDGSATLAAARRAWAAVATAVVGHEPVTMVVAPGDGQAAAAVLPPGVETVELALDDAWMRDSGPTFVRDAAGAVVAVDWVFNGWGAQEWAAWGQDRHLARRVAALAGAEVAPSWLVNEGGGIHVDGEGTVLLTETVQLDPHRNPGATRAAVEAEVHARLGTTTAIWLPRGLTRDYDEFGTRGHVDIVAAFVRPGVVVVHDQQDPAHPDHAVSAQVREVLAGAVDARGRRLEILDLPAPTVPAADGGISDYSYVNHYVANGAVVVGTFADPADAGAVDVLAAAYPGRTIVTVDGRDVFAFGGGVHCITQQQPAPAPAKEAR
ncbi:agmatine deiminase family protein [Georgenia ruanii]|uniref:Agmatine deiminase family protein n=2 Tax=Georgenia ruanii TaxID=348442 RepID=A0A7J9UYC3_9MICO|nr:agmatine deiminase family protein [Georgenia ruanii]